MMQTYLLLAVAVLLCAVLVMVTMRPAKAKGKSDTIECDYGAGMEELERYGKELERIAQLSTLSLISPEEARALCDKPVGKAKKPNQAPPISMEARRRTPEKPRRK